MTTLWDLSWNNVPFSMYCLKLTTTEPYNEKILQLSKCLSL